MPLPALSFRSELNVPRSRGRRKSRAEAAIDELSCLPMRLQAFLVEDLEVIRDNLVETMEEMAPMRFVGHAATEGAALQWLRTHQGQWDLAIVDLNLAEGSGLGVLRELRELRDEVQSHPLQKVVVLSNDVHEAVSRQCLKLGADEVFDKSSDVERLALYCKDQALQLRGLYGKTRSLF